MTPSRGTVNSRVLARRTLLRGIGGAVVGLPALEIMDRGARAAGKSRRPPRRFVISYGGISTGAYQEADELVPDIEGPRYDIKRALKPLAEYDIREDVSVVTGLTIPWQVANGEVPPGGRNLAFHQYTVGPQIAGTRTNRVTQGRPNGPTADQIVADVVGGDTQHKVLAFRVQPVSYIGGNQTGGNSGRQSWRRAPDGSLVPQEPIVSPQVAYESIFGGFVPSDPREATRFKRTLHDRRSVLDLVADDMRRLMPKLGHGDRARMDRHFEEVRALERRLTPRAPDREGGGGATCRAPAHPGADPTVGGAIKARKNTRQGYSTTAGYSDEDGRADVLTDLISLAFACDLSRVASYMLTEWKCYMNMYQVAGWQSDMHELTHGAAGRKIEAVSDCVAWLVKQWGKLIVKLKKLPEPDGSTVLDHTALVLFFEGGHGFDPEGNKKISSHSTENMAVLVGGHAGGLASRHLSAPGKHPAQAVLTAMNAVGVTAEALGDVEGNLPELFG